MGDRKRLNIQRRSIDLVKNYNFTKGLLIVLSIISVITVCSYVADLATGVSGAVGIFLVSICDLPGNKVHHLKNMLYGLLLAMTNLVLIQLSLGNFYLNLAVMPVLVVCTAYLSVFGKRASLVSFSGLLALVLAYAFPKTGWDIALGAVYVALGGLWFILLNILVHPLRYRRYRLGLLNDGIRLTADYLRQKSRQLTAADPDQLWPELINTHNQINEIRKVLTDYFLNQSPDRDSLGKQSREGVLYLELVDLVELGTAVPVRPESTAPAAAAPTHALAEVLESIAEALRCVAWKSRNFRSSTPEDLGPRLASVAQLLHAADNPMTADERNYVYMLYDNLEKQVTKLRSIERFADTREPVTHALFTREAKSRLRPQEAYGRGALTANFTPDSAVFRHCIRLAVVMVAGYLIGGYLGVHNAYWIILTIVVIMRPTYVQSKERSVQRTIGTLAGGVVAALVVTLTDSHTVYAIIGASAMPFVFIFLDKDYRISAFFVTLNLVFTYALLHPDAYTVISYRVVDTVIGALLAFTASRVLWPAWDSRSISKLIVQAIEGSCDYLRRESTLYINQHDDDLGYRIARRQAFVYLGELDASYVRTLKEPSQKRVSTAHLYRIVTLNHQILSSIAYLGTYLQYHAVRVSPDHFSTLIDDLSARLLACRDPLQERTATEAASPPVDTTAALAYFRHPPAGARAGEELQQIRLFLREYTYLGGLIGELGHFTASTNLLSGGPNAPAGSRAHGSP